jgi:hypothetical protein
MKRQPVQSDSIALPVSQFLQQPLKLRSVAKKAAEVVRET